MDLKISLMVCGIHHHANFKAPNSSNEIAFFIIIIRCGRLLREAASLIQQDVKLLRFHSFKQFVFYAKFPWW